MLRCSKCKGKNIEQKAWIDPNDETILDNCSEEEREDNWCRDCQEYINFEDYEEDYTPDPFTTYKEWKEDNM